MRKLLILPAAGQDLQAIWDYIAADNVSAANRVADRIDAALQTLLDLPGMGHRRADVADPAYRFWTVYSYVIAYRFDDVTLPVVRGVHGSRDFRRIFP